jgi:ABC-type nitrate/sulfonate/bicarbonate transport system substrate-binding protein
MPQRRAARAEQLFNYPSSGLIVHAKRIKERPGEIRRMIKAGIEANRYLAQHREETLQIMMEWMKIDKEMAVATYDGVLKSYGDDLSLPEDGLRRLIDEAKKMPTSLVKSPSSRWPSCRS